jgi:putative mRNA 3-end processing factor
LTVLVKESKPSHCKLPLHPEHWIKTDKNGLYCKALKAYVDPMQPVEHAIITHAHADHARAGHTHVYATAQTLDIMRIRYGPDHAVHVHPLAYEQTINLHKGQLTLYPAGHILGSAQVLIQYKGQRLVHTGDFKRQPDPTCEPFVPIACDVFVTEATFGLPVFQHPPIEDETQKLLASLARLPDACHLVGVYALGKCQRLLVALRQLGYHEPVYIHGALVNLCALYQQHGIALGELIEVSSLPDLSVLKGQIVLAPPSALSDRWSRKLPNVMTSMASGWMQIRARSKQKRAELPLIISDHSDWQDLITTIKQVNPKEVWVTHGREQALVHQAQQMGYKAKALSLIGYGDDEDAAIDEAARVQVGSPMQLSIAQTAQIKAQEN